MIATMQWNKFLERLRAETDITNFLRWPVIIDTMFVTDAPFVQVELDYLKSIDDWHLIEENLTEPQAGNPILYTKDKSLKINVSGNTIHHSYHIQKLYEYTETLPCSFSNVFEFGGGYGNMCRLFFKYGFKGNYNIHDFPEMNTLQEIYLNSIGVNDDHIGLSCNQNDFFYSQKDSSLFLSTWGISETPIFDRKDIMKDALTCDVIFIAFQKEFSYQNNLEYFQSFIEQNKKQFSFTLEEISHIPNNYYLAGVKK